MTLLRAIFRAAVFSIVGLTSAAADTFLIETRISAPRGDLSDSEHMRAVGTESGVMDTLFESGHIFFNIYNTPGDGGTRLPVERAIVLADETGAEFLLELIPEKDGVSWRFRGIDDPRSVDRGYEPISQVPDTLKGSERWAALGEILAQRITSILSSRQIREGPNRG